MTGSNTPNLGFNYRLSEINCALGLTQLKRIDEILQLRSCVARIVSRAALAGITGLILPAMTMAEGLMSWFVYVVRLDETYTASDRARIIERLTMAGIGCARYFAPVHLQPSYSDWRFSQALPVTEAQERAYDCLAILQSNHGR